ncbi:hypothetical protein O0L34_g19017 [Tuta absoluta]|nr:hypothetical protein O0L34_g19017 [Tuta absoluta]
MYATWSVTRLKDELRKRKAAITGKKAVLIERLEAYDRNNLIGVEEELEDETPIIPTQDKFRDVNASTTLPLLSKLHIQEFAERFQVPPKGRLLYESRSLVTLRVATEGNHFYFHAQCKAQMKKLLYIVILKMEHSGMIEESHCECAAGSGLEAHCKHIFTVLHGIEDLVRTKSIIMFQVCTEKLMTFKQPRKVFYDSPMQSHKLPSKEKKSVNVLYSPLKEVDIIDDYESYLKNLAIGLASTTGSKMPYLQLIKPANPYAMEVDHSYTEKSAQDLLLENLLLKNITEQKANDVQYNTVS